MEDQDIQTEEPEAALAESEAGTETKDQAEGKPQQPTLSPAAIKATITLIMLAVAVLAVMIFMPRVGMGAYVSRVCFALAFALFVAVIVVGAVARKPKGSDLAAVIAVAVVLSIPAVLMGGNALMDLPSLANPAQVELTATHLETSNGASSLAGTDADGTQRSFDLDEELAQAAREAGVPDQEGEAAGGTVATVTCLPHTQVLLEVSFSD